MLIRRFLYNCVQSTWQFLPTVASAHSLEENELDSWLLDLHSIEAMCHVSLTNDVGRRASLNQGRCFLRIAKEAFQSHPKAKYIELLSFAINAGLHEDKLSPTSLRGHYSLIFGALCQLLGLSLPVTVRLYLRIVVRDVIMAASRLNIVGPLEGAKLQAELAPVMEEQCKLYLEKRHVKLSQHLPDLPTQTWPIFEIIQSNHDLLYSRLFNS